jgi:hypothetical protein
MQILKNLWNSVKNLIKKNEVQTNEPTMKVVASSVKENRTTGLPIETYIPQVESPSKEVVGMSPVTITETPAKPNELSPAESASEKKVAKPYKRKYYKKKPKNAAKAADKPKNNKPTK